MSKSGMMVWGPASINGQLLLKQHKMTFSDVEKALENYALLEPQSPIGTKIGFTENGFFAARQAGWSADMKGAFDTPFIHIPWDQLRLCLMAQPGPDGKLAYPAGSPSAEQLFDTKKVMN